MSHYGGQLKQQIRYSFTLLISYMVLNQFKISFSVGSANRIFQQNGPKKSDSKFIQWLRKITHTVIFKISSMFIFFMLVENFESYMDTLQKPRYEFCLPKQI